MQIFVDKETLIKLHLDICYWDTIRYTAEAAGMHIKMDIIAI